MKLYSIIADNWKMDGGTIFGVVPKSIWTKHCPSDENNLVKVTTRCLLIETNDKLILIDTGMGNKRKDRFYEFKYLFGDVDITDSLKDHGFTADDITDVIFTHLHDDHCGGSIKYDEEKNPVICFKNAQFWCSEDQYKLLLNPNKREIASFYEDNILAIKEAGKLNLITEEQELFKGIFIKIFNGHTQGQIIPIIKKENKTLAFTADFIPSSAHISLPYIASFDMQPLLVLKEKEEFLEKAFENDYILFFEHEYENECCTLSKTKKGYTAKEKFKLEDIDF